jgi:hypothetical protein
MDGVDANELAERLGTEQQDYWVHVEAGSPLEKYPGECLVYSVAGSDA